VRLWAISTDLDNVVLHSCTVWVDWKCRTWKWRTIKIAGHEIAGHENDGPKMTPGPGREMEC